MILALPVSALLLSFSPWTGDMHPKVGFPKNCSLDVVNQCAPTYDALASAQKLWTCPSGNRIPHSTWPAQCVPGTGENPLCPNLNASDSCCCPADGCYAEPRFNTVIGVCRGSGCACGSTATTAPSCAPQGAPDNCGSHGGTQCTGASVACCFGNDVSRLVPFYSKGSAAKLNYIAAYDFDERTQRWVLQPESSFNTDGSRPAHDLMLPYGGLTPAQAWLAPQPGGSVYWSLGYYAAGAPGVGSKGALMFVMSAEEFWGATWYMLNQIELDRGPGARYPAANCSATNENCWASGNAGEMDFLEPAWNNGKATDASVKTGYRASYSTQNNQVGRNFVGGVNSGGFGTDNYLLTASPDKPEAVIYVAVVDRIGNWLYRMPAAQAEEIWPGITRKNISTTLQPAPAKRPGAVNPCTSGYCLVFTSNCQAKTHDEALKQQCMFNGQQGFCTNWWSRMQDTQQPLVPDETCERDVRGGITMPWCKEMVGRTPSPSPKPAPTPKPAPAPKPVPTPPGSTCGKCSTGECAAEGCGATVPFMCTIGVARGGCSKMADFWPKSGACSACCDTSQC